MNADHERRIRALEAQLANLRSAGRPAGLVAASYSTDAGQSIPNDTSPPFTVIDYEDEEYDPLGLVTTGASWTFTCPVAGVYRVYAAALFSATANWAVGETAGLWLSANGFLHRQIARYDWTVAGASVTTWLSGATTRQCVAGDALSVTAYQNSGAALTLVGSTFQNYVSIQLIGSS